MKQFSCISSRLNQSVIIFVIHVEYSRRLLIKDGNGRSLLHQLHIMQWILYKRELSTVSWMFFVTFIQSGNIAFSIVRENCIFWGWPNSANGNLHQTFLVSVYHCLSRLKYFMIYRVSFLKQFIIYPINILKPFFLLKNYIWCMFLWSNLMQFVIFSATLRNRFLSHTSTKWNIHSYQQAYMPEYTS